MGKFIGLNENKEAYKGSVSSNDYSFGVVVYLLETTPNNKVAFLSKDEIKKLNWDINIIFVNMLIDATELKELDVGKLKGPTGKIKLFVDNRKGQPILTCDKFIKEIGPIGESEEGKDATPALYSFISDIARSSEEDVEKNYSGRLQYFMSGYYYSSCLAQKKVEPETTIMNGLI